MRLPIDDSKIPEEDINQTVLLLLEIIRQQAELIRQLKDEIARLKNQKFKKAAEIFAQLGYKPIISW